MAWNEEETAFLVDNWPELSYGKIGAELGKSRNVVANKMYRLRNPKHSDNRPGARPGEGHHGAKLTEAHVREIRAKYAAGGRSHFSIGEEYYPLTGVEALSTISAIIMRKTWRHI